MAGSRWVTTPMTLRSRTASWTRATELSRATASGRIAWGNRIVSRSGRIASSDGTSERFTSFTPPDSKSGARSSLESLIWSSSTSCEGRTSARLRRDLLRESRLEGPHHALRLGLALVALLARPAQGRERQRLQPGLGDLRRALRAHAVGAALQAAHGLVDPGQGLGLH